MTIYIDVIFLENLILNFIILYATGLISKSEIKFIRIIIRKFYWRIICNSILLYELTKYLQFNMENNFISYNGL